MQTLAVERPMRCSFLFLASALAGCSVSTSSPFANLDADLDDVVAEDSAISDSASEDAPSEDGALPDSSADTGSPDTRPLDAATDSGFVTTPEPTISPAYFSDSLNCGGAGHSCLGGSCSGGLCQKTLVRSYPADTKFRQFAVFGSTLTVYSAMSSSVTISRGPTTPLAADTFSMSSSEIVTGGIRQLSADDAAVYGIGDSKLRRFDVGTKTSSALATSAKGYVTDASRAYFFNNMLSTPGVYAAPLTGGTASVLASDLPGIVAALANDASKVFVVNVNGELYSVPKTGGAYTAIPVTGAPDGTNVFLRATPTRVVVGSYLKSGSAIVGSTIWSVPRAGGAANVIFAWPGVITTLETSDEYVYFSDRRTPPGGSGSWTSILRRIRADGSAPIIVARLESTNTIPQLAVDTSYVYWLDWNDGDRVVRAPR